MSCRVHTGRDALCSACVSYVRCVDLYTRRGVNSRTPCVSRAARGLTPDTRARGFYFLTANGACGHADPDPSVSRLMALRNFTCGSCLAARHCSFRLFRVLQLVPPRQCTPCFGQGDLVSGLSECVRSQHARFATGYGRLCWQEKTATCMPSTRK